MVRVCGRQYHYSAVKYRPAMLFTYCLGFVFTFTKFSQILESSVYKEIGFAICPHPPTAPVCVPARVRERVRACASASKEGLVDG